MIFISYREDDEPVAVRNIFKSLSKVLKRQKIYFDKNDIVGGADVKLALTNQIFDSKIIVVPIGKRWFTLMRERQQKESSNPDEWDSIDWLTWEIELALAAHPKKVVIPVLLDQSGKLNERDLPDRIKGLARKAALVIHQDNDSNFENGVRNLAAAIKSHIQGSDAPRSNIFLKLGSWFYFVEEKLWSSATYVGNSVLERYSRLRPNANLARWIQRLPLDLILAILPISLCIRFYLVENANWVGKFGVISGNIAAGLVATIFGLLCPYSPINMAAYLQNRDEGLPRPIYRFLRGLAGAAILFELPIVYLWILKLNRNGEVRWLDQTRDFLF